MEEIKEKKVIQGELDDVWMAAMLAKIKELEGRIFRGKWATVRKGDILKFKGKTSEEYHEFEVVKEPHWFANFTEAFGIL